VVGAHTLLSFEMLILLAYLLHTLLDLMDGKFYPLFGDNYPGRFGDNYLDRLSDT
jgi:hypothetical protein